MLGDKDLVAAAQPYVRIMIRVPEAYLLLRPYATTRPGFLVLDADGRRVDSIALPGLRQKGEAAATVARRLRAALEAPAMEQVRARLSGSAHCIAKVRNDVAAWKDVEKAELEGDILTVQGKAGTLLPKRLWKVANGHIVQLEMEEPVAVGLTWPESLAGKADAKASTLRAVERTPGVWYTERGARKVFVARLLLQPGNLSLNGIEPDVEARAFELPGAPRGPAGFRVARAPLKVPGVLSVFPDVFNDGQVVVARRSVEWDAVVESFRKAGSAARPKK